MATAAKYDTDTKSIEKSPSLGLGSSSASADDVDMSQINKKSLLRRVDLHVLPMLVIVYIFAFLDRVNIGNASVFGMSKELGLKGNQYNVALCVFFIPYILFEIPSNLVLKAVSPRVFLSICIFLFGMVTLCQGFVKKYEHLIVTRLLLGLFETGIFPGAFYILSMWYPRHASQKRFTFFFLSTAIAGAFGGLLAYALGHINAGGYTPWRWIFIIEGAITCAIGILSYFTLPDFPEEAKWLTDNERKYIQKRINKDIGDADRAEKIKLSDLTIVFTDYRFVLSAIAYFACVIPIYAFAYFCPTILKGWGISALMTQVRTIPIWAFAWIFSMSVAILSDRIRKRFVFIMVPTSIALIGFIILIALPDAHIATANVGVKYFALFLCLAGMFASTPIVVGWFTTNLRTHKQRSIGSAWQIAFGNCGGIVATFVFPAEDGPAYSLGYSVCVGAIVVILMSCSTLFIMMRTENKKFERLEQEQNEEGRAEGEKGFRYLI